MSTATHRDLAPERHEHVCEILRQNGVVRVDELCAELNVSPATIRRDLEALEAQGRTKRVHGGAVNVDAPFSEPLFDDKAVIAGREKKKIAGAAYRLIQQNETIYLDGGSTILELAHLLHDRSDLTVVTNSLRAAIELSGKGPELIMLGGQLRRRSQTLIGPLSRCLTSELHVDRAFMGTIGITLQEGMTTTDPSEAYTKTLMMKQANSVVLLTDSSKIGQVSFASSGRIEDLDVLITDSGATPRFLKSLQKQQLEVITV